MAHYDEMTCLLYLEGQLERPRALELSAHAESCPECSALLRALEGEARLLAQSLKEADESVPARLLVAPEHKAVPWAWIISIGLAAAGPYTLWTQVVAPWWQQLNEVGLGERNLLTILFFGGVFWKGWQSVINLVEIAATATLGVLAFSLLRRRWRRWTTFAAVMSVLVALATPTTAGAAELRHAESFTLEKGEVIKNDLILTGATVRIDGTVDGDLIVFCQSLTMNGHVTGDVIAFAQLLRIRGPVDGNVRAFANMLNLEGTVAKNVTAFVGHSEFDSESRVGGGAMLFAGDTNLQGRIGRDLLGFIGRATINGHIGGNARLQSGRMAVGPGAEVAGKFIYRGEHEPEVSPQARLASPIEKTIVRHTPSYTRPRYYWHQLLKWGAAFVFGLVWILLIPNFFGEVVSASRRYGPSLGIGIATFFAVPLLAIIAAITIVGLAVGIGSLLLWCIALYSAQVFVGAWLGEALMGPAARAGVLIGRLAIGLLVLRILTALPYIGDLLELFVIFWGMGALAVALYKRTRPLPGALDLGPAAGPTTAAL